MQLGGALFKQINLIEFGVGADVNRWLGEPLIDLTNDIWELFGLADLHQQLGLLENDSGFLFLVGLVLLIRDAVVLIQPVPGHHPSFQYLVILLEEVEGVGGVGEHESRQSVHHIDTGEVDDVLHVDRVGDAETGDEEVGCVPEPLIFEEDEDKLSQLGELGYAYIWNYDPGCCRWWIRCSAPALACKQARWPGPTAQCSAGLRIVRESGWKCCHRWHCWCRWPWRPWDWLR